MKKLIIVFAIIFLIVGCAQWDAIKTSGRATAQEVADEALKVTLWKLCKGSSIGAINRWIQGDDSLATAYNTICNRNKQANVIAVE